MAIETGVSPTNRLPQSHFRFIFQLAGGALTPLERRVALIGSRKIGLGTAIDGTIYELTNSVQTDDLFGVGTPLALMARKAFEVGALVGQSPRLHAVSMPEPSGGTARTFTFTVTGTATSAGVLNFTIKGVLMSVGVSIGHTPTDIALAISNEIARQRLVLPVTAAPAVGVVTCTSIVKGENGNDIKFTVEQSTNAPAGVTLVAAAAVSGAGVADATAALAATAGSDYDALPIENHKSADITLAVSHVTTAWGISEKNWRFIFFGETGSLGTATALATAANDKAIVVANLPDSGSLPCEVATAVAVRWAATNRPNATVVHAKLPLAHPPAASRLTNTQANTALGVGVTPLRTIVDANSRISVPGVVEILDIVTTQTTQGGQPFEATRDIVVPNTAAFTARQIDIAYSQRFSAEQFPDGVLFTDDIINQVSDMVVNVLKQEEGANILRNVDVDIAMLRLERDLQVPTRLNIEALITIVVGLKAVAFVIRTQVGGN